jgi:Fe-S cluster biosynthesis and repair protein YggX
MSWKQFYDYIKNTLQPYFITELDKRYLTMIINKGKSYKDYGNDDNRKKMQYYGANTLEYVLKQDQDFIDNYIIAFKDECMNAYIVPGEVSTRNTMSCPGGIYERILLCLRASLLAKCSDNESGCTQEYNEILEKVFRTLDKNELMQEWSNNFLEKQDFINENNLKPNDPRTKEFLKNHFIEFMRKKYRDANQLSERIETMILKLANDNDYVFNILAFGGRRKKRNNRTKKRIHRTKKHNNKSKKNKNKKNKNKKN